MNRKQTWEREVRTTITALEHEWKQFIAHVNDRIVPEVRTGAGAAMESVAGGLRRAADWLDANRGTRRV
jgi:hypothetical protein